MTSYIYVVFAILGGMMIGIQAPINATLGKRIGPLEGAFTSFFIGTLFLFFLVLFLGKGNILHVFSVPKWLLVGGFLGSFFITVIIFIVPKVGAASAIFAGILGQMLISVIIDHFGLFGVPKLPINWSRVLGIVCMLIGLFFIFRVNLQT